MNIDIIIIDNNNLKITIFIKLKLYNKLNKINVNSLPCDNINEIYNISPKFILNNKNIKDIVRILDKTKAKAKNII